MAYSGKTPVYATLISSGRAGLGDPDETESTPRGTFMVYQKEVASTMDGDEDIAMDRNGLYREETFTDRRVGTLQRLTPVTASGADDATRKVLYVGQTQVLTPAGALPLT